MIAKAIFYQFSLLKRRWPYLLFVILFFCSLAVLLTFIPSLSPVQPRIEYPKDTNRTSVLLSYEKAIEAMETAVASGEKTQSEVESSLRLLRYFVSTSTTQYDYLPFEGLFSPRTGMTSMAYGFSLMEGAGFLSAGLGVMLGCYFSAFPCEKGYFRPAVLSGASRRSLFLGTVALSCLALFVFDISTSFASLFLLGPFFHVDVLIPFGESYAGISIGSMWLSRSIGLFLSGLFYYSITSFVGLLSRNVYLSAAIPLIALGFFWLCTNLSAPSWGNYGQLVGFAGYLILLLPFSNIVIGPAFGMIWPVGALFGGFILLDGFLLFASLRRFRRMAL